MGEEIECAKVLALNKVNQDLWQDINEKLALDFESVRYIRAENSIYDGVRQNIIAVGMELKPVPKWIEELTGKPVDLNSCWIPILEFDPTLADQLPRYAYNDLEDVIVDSGIDVEIWKRSLEDVHLVLGKINEKLIESEDNLSHISLRQISELWDGLDFRRGKLFDFKTSIEKKMREEVYRESGTVTGWDVATHCWTHWFQVSRECLYNMGILSNLPNSRQENSYWQWQSWIRSLDSNHDKAFDWHVRHLNSFTMAIIEGLSEYRIPIHRKHPSSLTFCGGMKIDLTEQAGLKSLNAFVTLIKNNYHL